MSLWWAAMRFYLVPLLVAGLVFLVAKILARIVTGSDRGF